MSVWHCLIREIERTLKRISELCVNVHSIHIEIYIYIYINTNYMAYYIDGNILFLEALWLYKNHSKSTISQVKLSNTK